MHLKLAHLTYSLVGQLFKLKNKAEFKEDLLFSYVYFNGYLGKSRPQELLDTRHEVFTTRSKVNLGVRIGGRAARGPGSNSHHGCRDNLC